MCKCNPETRTYSVNTRTGKRYATCDSCREWHQNHFSKQEIKDKRKIYEKSPSAIISREKYDTSEKGQKRYKKYVESERGEITRRVISVNYNSKKRGRSEKITTDDLSSILEANKKLLGFLSCSYCSINVEETYEIDHDIPLSKEGSNEPTNLIVSCAECNNKKHTLTAAEFREKRKKQLILTTETHTI